MTGSARPSPAGVAAGDLADYAFREDGAWELDPAALAWAEDIEALRARARARVPAWVRRNPLPPLGRFSRAATAVGSGLVSWWARERGARPEERRAALSRRLRLAFETLGPAYIKLGQILASGNGVFPAELVDEFKRCRDRVPPEPFATVRTVVERELGGSLDSHFASFERTPLASASIAQVHRATLRDGTPVVVKVQRPGVARRVRQDVAAMAWIAPWLVGRIPVAALSNPPALVELFAETIVEELDFRLEAQNMMDVARVLREAGQRAIVVPRPHPELVTRGVLVMERLEGFHADDVEGMRRAGIDPAEVLRALMISFLEGAMIYGVFHGDLHGGNLAVLRDGRVALFDYGITARMSGDERLAFLRMMMTGAANDLRGQLAAFRDLGALPPDADLDGLVKALGLDRPVRDPTRLAREELVGEIQRVIKALLAQGARLPKPLMLYVKNMIVLDASVATYAPDLDLFQEVARIYGYFARRHGARIAADIGFDPGRTPIDLEGMRVGLGLEEGHTSLTHRELLERRRTLRERLGG